MNEEHEEFVDVDGVSSSLSFEASSSSLCRSIPTTVTKGS